MESIANLIQDDPWLTMPREDRIAAHKRRRQLFRSKKSIPTPLAMAVRSEPVAAPMTDPPAKEPWFAVLEELDTPISLGTIPRVEDIISAAVKYFKIPRLQLLSDRRSADLIIPRHITYYLCRTLTARSLPFISSRMGYRDHSTGHYAIGKITRLIETDLKVAQHVAALTHRITGYPA